MEAAVSSRAKGATPLRGNAASWACSSASSPAATFWMVGDQSLLQNLPSTIPSPGGGGNSINLPALKSLIVTGDLDPDVTLAITGETPDAAAATNLADIVRGLVALASLQASQKPELQGLAQAISVTTEQSQVQVNARIPYTLIEALQPKKPPVAAEAGAAK